LIAASVDLDQLQNLTATAPALEDVAPTPAPPTPDIRIGIAQDRAFGFYYPDDLEAFAQAGAKLVPFDALHDPSLPDIDGLFIGGGFPETQMSALSANQPLRHAIKTAIENGLPTYAECGGLMYLCRSLNWQDAQAEMVGVVPADALMCARPQGRGYTRHRPTASHPWGEAAQEIRAHEFHYARLENLPEELIYSRDITRGAGITGAKDGLVIYNLLAGFCHLRNTPSNPWVARFVEFTRQHKHK